MNNITIIWLSPLHYIWIHISELKIYEDFQREWNELEQKMWYKL